MHEFISASIVPNRAVKVTSADCIHAQLYAKYAKTVREENIDKFPHGFIRTRLI